MNSYQGPEDFRGEGIINGDNILVFVRLSNRGRKGGVGLNSGIYVDTGRKNPNGNYFEIDGGVRIDFSGKIIPSTSRRNIIYYKEVIRIRKRDSGTDLLREISQLVAEEAADKNLRNANS